MTGALTGSVAGLATITPAAGYVQPWAALVIGVIAAFVCYGAIQLRAKLKWDDALDVWACHGVGGTLGVIMTGVFRGECRQWSERFDRRQSAPVRCSGTGGRGHHRLCFRTHLVDLEGPQSICARSRSGRSRGERSGRRRVWRGRLHVVNWAKFGLPNKHDSPENSLRSVGVAKSAKDDRERNASDCEWSLTLRLHFSVRWHKRCSNVVIKSFKSSQIKQESISR